jgi:hypothetical protein
MIWQLFDWCAAQPGGAYAEVPPYLLSPIRDAFGSIDRFTERRFMEKMARNWGIGLSRPPHPIYPFRIYKIRDREPRLFHWHKKINGSIRVIRNAIYEGDMFFRLRVQLGERKVEIADLLTPEEVSRTHNLAGRVWATISEMSTAADLELEKYPA